MENSTHGNGDSRIVVLLFERIDNSANKIIENFGDFLPGERSNWSSQVTSINAEPNSYLESRNFPALMSWSGSFSRRLPTLM